MEILNLDNSIGSTLKHNFPNSEVSFERIVTSKDGKLQNFISFHKVENKDLEVML